MLSLGSFHFEIAMVLREAKFTNSILTNAEVWHNMQSKHTDSLEKYDLTLLRNIQNAHAKTATEAFYLELGIYPLKYHLAIRRITYLWTILHSDSSELRRNIYDMQQYKAIKGDWGKLVDEEKTKYDINILNVQRMI